MRPMSRTLLALGLFSVVSGGLGADARAGTGRIWVGSFTANVRPGEGPPVEILIPLAEGGFGVAINFEQTTGHGQGADRIQRIPVARLESFFSHNQLISVLVEQPESLSASSEAATSQLSGGYAADESLWSELSASEAVERFNVVLATLAVLLTGADLPLVDGLAPFAMAPADSGDVHKEIFFLADGEPNGDAWSPFTLEVIGDVAFGEEDLADWGTYGSLYPRDFMENPLISSMTPAYGIRTPGEVYDVWVYPVVADEDDWWAARAALEEAVGLSSTQPLAPAGRLPDGDDCHDGGHGGGDHHGGDDCHHRN